MPHLKKIHKINESHDTPIEFCKNQHFFMANQQILLYQEIQTHIAFWYIISNSFNFFVGFNDCFSRASNEDLKEYEMIMAIKNIQSIWICRHRLSLQILKLNVAKAKIRKSGPKLYFENSALCTLNLCYPLNRKCKTIFLKLLMFQWFEQGTFTHYVIMFGTDLATLLPLFLFEDIY